MEARAQQVGTDITNGWFMLDAITHFFVLFALSGHVRSMSKWFPWTKKRVFLYKLVRFVHATLFLVTQLVSTEVQGNNVSQAVNAAIAYFSVTMVLLHQLFAVVIIAERTLRLRRDAEKEALLPHNQLGAVDGSLNMTQKESLLRTSQ